MTAKTKPLNVIPAVPGESMTEYAGFELPVPRAACKMINPDNVKELIDLLRNEAKVI
jgi:electron transfer flavoprotein beta subunit